MGICEGRIAIITGAGRGLGRAHAVELARHGARVVVNDVGVDHDGTGRDTATAQAVVDEIRGAGGDAVASGDDIAEWDGAARLVATALDTYGGVDVLVNNAGFVRDRMVVSTSEDEWDAVVRVHLKGHFAPTRHASSYWRDRSEARDPGDAPLLNTRRGAGLLGSGGRRASRRAEAGAAP